MVDCDRVLVAVQPNQSSDKERDPSDELLVAQTEYHVIKDMPIEVNVAFSQDFLYRATDTGEPDFVYWVLRVIKLGKEDEANSRDKCEAGRHPECYQYLVLER